MLTHYAVVLTFISSIIFALNVLPVETAPSNIKSDHDFTRYPIVYRRFIRRRPPMYPDDNYMEEIVEIFDTKEKPPIYGRLMTDEDVDQFIYCDFNRHLDKCKQYWKFRNRPFAFLTTNATPKTITINHAISKSSATEAPTVTSTHPSVITMRNSKIPVHNEVEEYIYSDEIQEVERNLEGNTNDKDYYYYAEESVI